MQAISPNDPVTAANVMELPAEAHETGAIRANLLSIEVVIHRPSGRLIADKDKISISAQTEVGDQKAVDKDRMTRPQWKYDGEKVSDFWPAIDKNERDIKGVLGLYSANDTMPGVFLVSANRIAPLLARLTFMKEERLGLADKLAADWPAAKERLKNLFPDHYFQIEPNLPDPGTFHSRFGVSWHVRRLSTMDPGELDLRELSAEDAHRVAEDLRAMAAEQMKGRVKVIYDQIIGEVAHLAEDIVDNESLKTGKRRSGALGEMMTVLQRAMNFSQIIDDQTVIARIQSAYEAVRNVKDIQSLNSLPVVQEAVTAQFRNLRGALNEMSAQSDGRVRRRIILD